MKSFVENQNDAVIRIRDSLDKVEMIEARRHVHTLKGLAATIGAGNLHQKAMAFEQALIENKNGNLNSMVKNIEIELNQLIIDLQKELKIWN